MKKLLLSITMLTIIGMSNPLKSQTPNLQWVKTMGGSAIDKGNSMVLDASNNVYTTGNFSNTGDFDPGAGIYNLTSLGMEDVFISKLDSSGNFIWAKSLGGLDVDNGASIAIDDLGNCYITGGFHETVDFDPGAGTSNLTSAGGFDIFVLKLDAVGNFVWAVKLGAANIDEGYSIEVDASGNIYTTGYFRWAVDFDPGVGVFSLTSTGGDDLFISKLDSNGNFVWAKSMGGINISSEIGYCIALDDSQNVYITGTFETTVDFDPGVDTFSLTPVGSSDAFISKLDNLGNFVWAKQMGGSNIDAGNYITLDASANVYTTGFFWGAGDFDPGAGTFNLTPIGDKDIYISKLNAAGNFVWAKAIGGTGIDAGQSIALDASGNVYTTGFFSNTADFDPDAGSFNLTSSWGGNAFVSKLDATGNFIEAIAIADVSGYGGGYSISIDPSNNIYLYGSFGGVVDFDLGAGTFNLSSVGNNDLFVNKMGQSGVGITETEWFNAINIYPNPTRTQFKLSNFPTKEQFEVQVTDMLGTIIHDEKVYGRDEYIIDLNFAKGIYLVRISNQKNSEVRKLVVE